MDNEALAVAKGFYLIILPVATGIITHWCAARSASIHNYTKRREENNDNEKQDKA